jgi:hypothetical protein
MIKHFTDDERKQIFEIARQELGSKLVVRHRLQSRA